MNILFSYAFRPFFLLNAAFAVIAMAVWLFTLHGAGPATLPADVTSWHAHEMVIGFVMAAVAGFILTAVATWTGRPAVQGAPLILLVGAWLAGRIAMSLASVLTPVWVMSLDMIFPVLLILLVGREVIGGGSSRNYPIILITVLFAVFNLLFHASITGYVSMSLNAEYIALYLLIHLVLLLVTVIAGRIIPNFTANWLRAKGNSSLPNSSALIDRSTILLTIATGLFAAVMPLDPVTGVLAALAGLFHAIRLSRWCGLATRSEPLLFILHVAYAWLPTGYALTAMAIFGWPVTTTAALHALTVGAIGTMILGVTTRVALAHTGRKLHAARLTVITYRVLSAAVLARLISTFSPNYLVWLDVSVAAWIATFAIIGWVHWPVLTAPRVDE